MSSNISAAKVIFKQIRAYFNYKSDSYATGTVVSIGSDRIKNNNIDWETVGVEIGDRIEVVDGENTATTYVKTIPTGSYLEVEDEFTFDSTSAEITIYFIPKLFKEYATEQVDMPYDILTFIGRKDTVIYPNDRIQNFTFQINLYDDNSDDTDIEETSDEYIRIFDRISVCGIENLCNVIHCRFDIDSGIKRNEEFANSNVIYEKAISFSLVIKEI